VSVQQSGSTFTDVYPILKEYYGRQEVKNLMLKKFPLLAMLEKDTNFAGKYYPQPVQFGTTNGYAQFTEAQTNQSPDLLAEFMVPIVRDYAIATIDGATKEATRNDKGAFENAARLRVDGAINDLMRREAQALYRTGTGTIGRIATGGITAGVITLAESATGIFFQKGQVLQASSTDGGGTTRAGVGYVIGVDPQSGTVTVSATSGGAAGTPSGWAAGDYLYPKGDQNSRPTGILGWLPVANRPTPGTSSVFFGVDRSVDPTRLAGVYLDTSDQTIEEGLIDGLSQVNLFGGTPDYIFVHPTGFRALQKTLQARKTYAETVIENGEISFQAIVIQGDSGPVPVLSDPFCVQGYAFALQMDTWKLFSMGDVPKILTYDDGITMFRTSNNDSLECRVGAYFNLVCNAPGYNGVFKISV
jgi:hypothetical protein